MKHYMSITEKKHTFSYLIQPRSGQKKLGFSSLTFVKFCSFCLNLATSEDSMLQKKCMTNIDIDSYAKDVSYFLINKRCKIEHRWVILLQDSIQRINIYYNQIPLLKTFFLVFLVKADRIPRLSGRPGSSTRFALEASNPMIVLTSLISIPLADMGLNLMSKTQEK